MNFLTFLLTSRKLSRRIIQQVLFETLQRKVYPTKKAEVVSRTFVEEAEMVAMNIYATSHCVTRIIANAKSVRQMTS
jgi:hypothetical protein